MQSDPPATQPPESSAPPPGAASYTFGDFLESVPPSREVKIADLVVRQQRGVSYAMYVQQPRINLFCETEGTCGGVRQFRWVGDAMALSEAGARYWRYVSYRCGNCQITQKHFSLALTYDSIDSEAGSAYKFGELPQFGPRVAPRLIRLIQPDRAEFMQGRRAESLGMGRRSIHINYRRVVERQKEQILSEVLKLAVKLNAPEPAIAHLQSAIKELQFTKAMHMAEDALPESLKIDGHNPLTLLHNALSEGVHNLDDETCLQMATAVRTVLAELSERLAQAMKDEAELHRAVTTLAKARAAGKTDRRNAAPGDDIK